MVYEARKADLGRGVGRQRTHNVLKLHAHARDLREVVVSITGGILEDERQALEEDPKIGIKGRHL